MATKRNKLREAHLRRKMRIRKKVQGTAERPRLVVVRSLKHITASLVNDDQNLTIGGVSDNNLPELSLDEKAAKEVKELPGKTAAAFQVGLAIAEKAKEQGVTRVVFDRNGRRYHGRIKAVADGARKGGLEF